MVLLEIVLWFHYFSEASLSSTQRFVALRQQAHVACTMSYFQELLKFNKNTDTSCTCTLTDISSDKQKTQNNNVVDQIARFVSYLVWELEISQLQSKGGGEH